MSAQIESSSTELHHTAQPSSQSPPNDETAQHNHSPLQHAPQVQQQIHHDASTTEGAQEMTEPVSTMTPLQQQEHQHVALPHDQQEPQVDAAQFMEVDQNHLVMESRKRERDDVEMATAAQVHNMEPQTPVQQQQQEVLTPPEAEQVLAQVQTETDVSQLQGETELMNGLQEQQPQTQLQQINHPQTHHLEQNHQMQVNDAATATTNQMEANDMVGTAAKRARLSSNVPPPTTATTTTTTTVKRKSVPPPKKLNNEQWDAMFERLVQYKNQHGDCLVPKRYTSDPKLGTWVETQRVQYKKLQAAIGSNAAVATVVDPNNPTATPVVPITPNKRLNAERLERLESIGFAWSAKNLRKPKQVNANHAGAATPASAANTTAGNHMNGTDRTTNPPEEALAPNNDPNSISATTTITANNTSGPKRRSVSGSGTSAADAAHRALLRQQANEKQWADMYERLVAYKAAHGDCLVPKKYEQDPKLAAWVETQRVLYNRDFRKAGTAHTAIGTKVATPAMITAPSGAATTAGAPDMQGSQDVPDAPSTQGKSPEEWAMEIDTSAVTNPAPASQPEQGGGATAEDAAEVAATMEAVTMEIVEQVVPTEQQPSHPENAVPMDGVALTTELPLQVQAGSQAPAVVGDGKEGVAVGTTAVAPKKAEVALKRLTQERKDKLEELGFVWSLRNKRVDDHWDEMFNQLVEYKERHGDCLVPSRFEENFKLGKWVETQRYEYTKLQRAVGQAEVKSDEAKGVEEGESGKTGPNTKTRPTNPRLTEERLRRLEAIGFEWKVKHKMKRYYDRQWDTMFEKLLKYKEVNGHCLVPKRYPPDMKLGTWVHTQRIQYRKFLAGTSKKDGTASETPGDDGSAQTTNDELKIDDSSEVGAEENNTKAGEESSTKKEGEESGIKSGGEEQSFKPGSEVDEVSFRLTEDRRKRLEEAGFVWSAREVEKNTESHRITRNSYDDQWDNMFERLKKYKEKRGDCLVPKRCKEDPKLGTWVDTQRVQYKKMIKQLAKQGIEWTGPGPMSEAGSDPNGSGKPVVGRLTDDRIRRLEDIGFIWSLRDDWQKHYDELIEYKKVHGHCNVPARYQANRRLGIWVSAQRQQFKIMNMPEELKPRRSAPLTLDRIKLLNELGFTWTIRSRDSLGESWNQRLEELRKYRAENGNCLVPSRYPPNPELGVWVGTQRTQYRLFQRSKELGTVNPSSSAMNEDRIRQLEEMGFVWALRGGSDTVWKKRVSELMDYRAKYGNCDVSSRYKENAKLGSWAYTTRIQYKLAREGKVSTMDDEKIAELDSLGFSWEEPDEATAVLGIAPPTVERDETAINQAVNAMASAITAADEITEEDTNAVVSAAATAVGEVEGSSEPSGVEVTTGGDMSTMV